jgi:arsenical pump membrane protein
VLVTIIVERSPLWPVLRHVSWSIIPLVAGPFILVAAVEQTGAVAALASEIAALSRQSPEQAAVAFGTLWGFASNAMNNLPAGLFAANTLAVAQPPPMVTGAILIGVDLGPSLSITGSLATILREPRPREPVGFWRFLKIGIDVDTASLAAGRC